MDRAQLPVPPGLASFAGHLELRCSANEQGRSFLSHQNFRAPFHISKSYWDGHALLAQVINPTAGLFSGDVLESEVKVDAGAKLFITTPSASRVHTMNAGRAILRQRFAVASGGWLEYTPAILIPQANSRFRQETEIDLEAGAEMFFVETVAPGRVAHDEAFEFSEIEWQFNLRVGGKWIARERYSLRPEGLSLAALRNPFPQGYYGSCYLIADRIPENCWEKIRALASSDLLLGLTRLRRDAGWFRPGGTFDNSPPF
jgi:urease accessory protein